MNLSNMRTRHPLAYVLVTSVLAITCYNVVPGETLTGMIIQTISAAACVVVILALFDPQTIILQLHNSPTTQNSRNETSHDKTSHNQKSSNEKLSTQNSRNEKTITQKKSDEKLSDKKTSGRKSCNEKTSNEKGSSEKVRRGRIVATVLWVILIACGCGVATLFTEAAHEGWAAISVNNFLNAGEATLPTPSTPSVASLLSSVLENACSHPAALGGFLLLCVVTGIFEEALFRGVMFKGLASALRLNGSGHPLLVSALASSVVFGVLHISGGVPFSGSELVVAQLFAKAMQATLFGLIMAGLFAQRGSIWPVAALHATFNALSEAPLFLLTEQVPLTYASGDPVDLIILAASAALLVPFAIRSAMRLAASDHTFRSQI